MPNAADAPETESSTPQKPRAGKGFLEERPGHKSVMRAMNVVAFLCAAGFGMFSVVDPETGKTGVYITLGFLLAAFSPKALQKFAEEAIPA